MGERHERFALELIELLDRMELKKLFVVSAIPIEVLLLAAEGRLVVRIILLEVLPGKALTDASDFFVCFVDNWHLNR